MPFSVNYVFYGQIKGGAFYGNKGNSCRFAEYFLQMLFDRAVFFNGCDFFVYALQMCLGEVLSKRPWNKYRTLLCYVGKLYRTYKNGSYIFVFGASFSRSLGGKLLRQKTAGN